MKKFGIVVLSLLCIINLYARDMAGKIGLGFGWDLSLMENGLMDSPPNVFSTKIGLGSKIVLEPVLGLDFLNEDGSNTMEISFGAFLDYVLKSHPKTNLYFSGGIIFGSVNPPVGDAETTFGLLFGGGLEQFISDNFSLDLTLRSGFLRVSEGDYSISDFYIGNEKVILRLCWYY
ncbi:MAG: hypothetical protein ABIN61_07305 [candidate division WOR-3 bacterium]